jgi:hypothetical protein
LVLYHWSAFAAPGTKRLLIDSLFIRVDWRVTMTQRELIKPHEKRYQRRNEDGTFSESDDQSASLSRDVRQHAGTKKPRNEGDKGD